MGHLFIFILTYIFTSYPQNTHEIGPTKYPREKTLDSRNTQEKKFWTYDIPKRKNFGPTNDPIENILDPRNTQEKKFWSHEIATRKIFGHAKNPREKILDPRNSHEKKIGPFKARLHYDTGHTIPTEFSTLF